MSSATSAVVRLGQGFESGSDNECDAVPFGYVQGPTPPASSTKRHSHRVRTIDLMDDFLQPKRPSAGRSRAAWNADAPPDRRSSSSSRPSQTPSEKQRDSTRSANPELLSMANTSSANRSSGDDAMKSVSMPDTQSKSTEKEREQRKVDHEVRRLRRKMEQIQRGDSLHRGSSTDYPAARRQSRPSTEGHQADGADGANFTAPPQPSESARRSGRSLGRHSSACSARAERGLEQPSKGRTSQQRTSTLSDGAPVSASRSRVSRSSAPSRQQDGAVPAATGTPEGAAAPIAMAMTSPMAAAANAASAEELDAQPWGPKPDIEPPGMFGKYDGEDFARFVPNPGLSAHDNMVRFLTTATPADVLVLCKVTRIKERPDTSKRKPAYAFVLQSGGVGGEEVPLLETKRTWKGKHVYYEFSVGTTFLGKLKCNFAAKKFTLFDGGVKVNKSGMIPVSQRGSEFREELASVAYTRSSRGPRQLMATIPAPSRSGSAKGSLFLVNRIPTWDTELKVHTLKYHHRATEKSVKNFQLVADSLVNKQENPPVLLRFGKVAKNTFNLDFRGPMTPLQAMAFTITAFEKNWSEALP